MAVRKLTLHEVELQDPRAPIWALNNATRSEVGLQGDILIGIPKLNGSKVDHLRIEHTWLPVELTGQIPRSQLLESSEFRQAITDRLIVIIDEDTAKRLQSKEGATSERKKLAMLRAHVKSGGAARTISDANVEISSGDRDHDQPEDTTSIDKGTRVGTRVEKIGGLEPAFKLWADRLTSRSDLDILGELKMRGGLKRSQAKYLLGQLNSKPQSQAALKKAIKKLDAKKAGR
ncbi:MAG: hypothetical protein ACN6OP_15555 [Pseudomonadales bacterium]